MFKKKINVDITLTGFVLGKDILPFYDENLFMVHKN